MSGMKGMSLDVTCSLQLKSAFSCFETLDGSFAAWQVELVLVFFGLAREPFSRPFVSAWLWQRTARRYGTKPDEKLQSKFDVVNPQ